jgi:hypothetical protein
MKKYNRKSVFKEQNHLLARPSDFIEVCEWHNGEGFDVTLSENTFSMSYFDFKDLKKLVKELEKNY